MNSLFYFQFQDNFVIIFIIEQKHSPQDKPKVFLLGHIFLVFLLKESGGILLFQLNIQILTPWSLFAQH